MGGGGRRKEDFTSYLANCSRFASIFKLSDKTAARNNAWEREARGKRNFLI